MYTKHPCTNCGTIDPQGQYWGLSNYFGISGHFCPRCYDKVSHDAYEKPRNLGAYEEILKKQKEANHALQLRLHGTQPPRDKDLSGGLPSG